MHLFDFFRRMFPAALPAAIPAAESVPRKGRDGSPSRPKKKPTVKKSLSVAPKKKPAPKKK